MDLPPSIKDSCSNLKVPKETRSFEMDSVGSYIPVLVAIGLKLEHENDCNEGKFHTRIGFFFFFNYTPLGLDYQFKPGGSLVGEGFWDQEKNQMCIVACQILANTYVGDSSIGISLWFPFIFTIKTRSHVMGSLWSNKNKNDPGYFSALSLRDLGSFRPPDLGMTYKYSLLDGARGCDAVNNSSDMGSGTYPDGSSKQHLSFSIFSKTKAGSSASGHANPLSIRETIFADFFLYETPMERFNVTVWNVSYEISFWFHSKSSSSSRNNTQIFAEGLIVGMGISVWLDACTMDLPFLIIKQRLKILWIAISSLMYSFLSSFPRKENI